MPPLFFRLFRHYDDTDISPPLPLLLPMMVAAMPLIISLH